MFVITVELKVKPNHTKDFISQIKINANASLALEFECSQFDICISIDDPNKFYLYEVYENKAAFEAHKETSHFKDFEKITANWIERKSVLALKRI